MTSRVYNVLRRNSNFINKFKYKNTQICLNSTQNNEEIYNLKNYTPEKIRNFSIIAHIDHGKTTLANKILEITNPNGNKNNFDKLKVEKEHGITVKAQTSTLNYKYKEENYLLNLIDTPGHGDFAFEVSRSLTACQGVVLLVDSTEGIQARTVTNFKLAQSNNLIIIPVLNKIDLENAKTDEVVKQIENIFKIRSSNILKISAKYGTGVDRLLDSIVELIPPPKVDRFKPFSALLFDLWYKYPQGVVSLLTVLNGEMKKGDLITSITTKKKYQIENINIINEDDKQVECLFAGQMGSIVTNTLNTDEFQIGDVFITEKTILDEIPIVKASKPTIFAGFYPLHRHDEPQFRAAMDKLLLNDSSVSFDNYFSPTIGRGYQLGFLGLLHLEVFKQRLINDYNAPRVFITTPNIQYKVRLKHERMKKQYGSSSIIITNPKKLPKYSLVRQYLQPIIHMTIITPKKHIESINSLCKQKKGIEISNTEIDDWNSMTEWKIPLKEIIINFTEELKRISNGKATFDYKYAGFKALNIVKLDIVINGVVAEELTTIVEWAKVKSIGKDLCRKLKDLIPQHVNGVGIEAKMDGNVVAMETKDALKLDFWVKQEMRGKAKKVLKEMRNDEKIESKCVGNVLIPRDVFIQLLEYSKQLN